MWLSTTEDAREAATSVLGHVRMGQWHLKTGELDKAREDFAAARASAEELCAALAETVEVLKGSGGEKHAAD